MDSPTPEIPQPKKRGRPRKIDLERASSSSAGTSAPPTPNAQPEDPLAAQEYALFGVAGIDDVLPLPPNDGPGNGVAGGLSGLPGAKRPLDGVAVTGPVGRAKRPKNVKFSPTKGKALARRSLASGGQQKSANASDVDVSLPNNDYCDACHGKGHFLCCDGGCLRSFHFACLEPPLELDDVPDESWYCKACRAKALPPPKPPKGYFRELIYKVECENPKAFTLSAEIKNFYKNVATGASGEFIDTTEHRPPSKITGRAIGQEDRDGYRIKDKLGKTMLCYHCNEAASILKQRRIISCDFCDQHWHLDCLDPPLTNMPPPTRKWMCPAHAAEHLLPKQRQPKGNTTTYTNQEPSLPNNGDIIILPTRDLPKFLDDFEELTVNRIRYQVPEETVILDFWGRVHEGPRLRSPQKQGLELLTAAQLQGSRESSMGSDESSLTSIGDLSDADPPEVIASYSGRKPSMPSSYYPPSETTKLDSLAMLAEGFFQHLVASEESYSGSNGVRDESAKEKPTAPNHHRRSTMGPNGMIHGEGLSGDKGKGRAAEYENGLEQRERRPSLRHSQWGASSSYSFSRNSASPSPSAAPLPTELKVGSTEDLKALMAVRKLMGRASIDVQKRAVLGFIEGAAIVPKLTYMDPEAGPQPWELPWDATEAKEETEARTEAEKNPAAPTPETAVAPPSETADKSSDEALRTPPTVNLPEEVPSASRNEGMVGEDVIMDGVGTAEVIKDEAHSAELDPMWAHPKSVPAPVELSFS
ncbi:hypothetical protein T439DRAFT_167600 [Meredithblackwellia eburnea MCA 4105]